MRSCSSTQRLMIFTFGLLVFGALSACLGCSAEAPLSAPEALRLRFPEQAAHVLQQEEAFVATAQGFAIHTLLASGGVRPVLAELPQEGSNSIRLQMASGFEVRVREMDAGGEGVLAEQAVAYPRAGGTSFWTAVPGGVEEWLQLEAGAVRQGEPVATWEVEGATVRERGDGVELIDASGVVRLSVTAPRAYAEGGREIRARLAGRDARVSLWVDAEGEALLVDPLWTSGGSIVWARYGHTATLLLNGQVLVVGGRSDGVELTSAELYDPGTNSWKPTGSMSTARMSHTATLLKSGKVLVVGGTSKEVELSSAELYDPESNSWQDAGMLSDARVSHTATLLPNGKVLVAGGEHFLKLLASAELYNPTNNTWQTTVPLTTVRESHTATLLQNGQVLVVGGVGGVSPGSLGYLADAEVYDPVTDGWTSAGALSTARYLHTATLLPNGHVLVLGGNSKKDILASAELYSSQAKGWTPGGALSTTRYGHTATLLPSGKVLVVGGYGAIGVALASAELFDPYASSSSPAGALATAREFHTATLLPSGKVLVVGGDRVGGILAEGVELYDPPPLGSLCASAADCQSGFCADGVCCDTACTAPCEACSVAAGAPSDGTCAPRICRALDLCHDAGTCDPATDLCFNSEKPSCDLSKTDSGPTIPTIVHLCKTADECSTGYCVDGVCCDTACREPCHSCAMLESIGICTLERAGIDLRHDCGPEANCLSTCGSDGQCIGAGMGTQCLPSQCDDDEVHGEGEADCPSAGAACPIGERVPFNCSPYRCVKALGACRSSCSSISDCAPPYVCDPSHHCVPPPPVASGEDSGCALSPDAISASAPRWLLLLLPALAVARRRRQKT